jgi:hypothetical protein
MTMKRQGRPNARMRMDAPTGPVDHQGRSFEA